jgi:dihydropteroate synthase
MDLSRQGAIMGIVNVTPDSFSDGGKFNHHAAAVEHGLSLLAEGAGILDIGGESTRPGATPVAEAEELARVVPVIRELRRRTDAVISVDTMKPAVAAAALEAGADIVNDVTGLADPAMAAVAASAGAGCVAMHIQGRPQHMQLAPAYTDVAQEIAAFFRERLASLTAAGISAEQIVFDPGIGFGKSLEHNLALLRSLAALSPAGRPLLLGVSRKSFIGKTLGDMDMARREWPTVALTSLGREMGVRIFRVHSVRPNVEALRMTEAILHGAPAQASV